MGRKGWTLAAVVLGSGIVFLDSTVVSLALPAIGEELPAAFMGTLEGQNYVFYGYLLSLSALLILAGGLADYFGRRKLFGIGLAGFGVTSVLCGLAPTLETLVAFRVLQGAAGAILVPGSLSIIRANFEGDEQGRAFGIWAGASGATTVFGPALGGALVATVSWRAIFLVNVPLVALGLWATYRHIGETRDVEASGKFDWLGASLGAVAVGGLTFGAIRGQSLAWRDPVAWAALVVGFWAAVAFPFAMRVRREPLVPLELFRSRNFSVTNVSTLLVYGPLYVFFVYLALFARNVAGYSELGLGIGLVPASLFLALFSTHFGRWCAQAGPRRFMAVGPVLMALGMLWFARFPVGSDPWDARLGSPSSMLPSTGYLVDMLPGLVLFGLGLMVMVAPLTTALMRSVPVRHAGVGSAFNNAVSRVAPQLVGALLFVAITASFQSSLRARFPDLDVTSSEGRMRLSPLNVPHEDLPEEVREAANEASARGFRLGVLVLAGLCVAGGAVNAVGIRDPDALGGPQPETLAAPVPGVQPEPDPGGLG